jgi:hypothetical protein
MRLYAACLHDPHEKLPALRTLEQRIILLKHMGTWVGIDFDDLKSVLGHDNIKAQVRQLGQVFADLEQYTRH